MEAGAGEAAMKNLEAEAMDLNVSASEESKGGIKYDVLLGDQKVVTPRVHAASPNVRPLSAEIIQLKISAANERRKSLESLRLASLSEKFRRIEDAQKKRDEELANLKENLEHKIEASSEKRETLIADMKTKLNTHNTNHLQEVRQNLVSSLSELEEKAKAKLETAEKNREKIIQEKLELLKKHDVKVELIRTKRSSTLVTEEEMPQDTTNTSALSPQ